MKLSELVTLLEMPQFVDRELPREEPQQAKMSVDAFEREYSLLTKYNVNYDGGEPVTVVVGLRHDKTGAVSGDLFKDPQENRWYVHIRINLTFHEEPQQSEIPGDVLQVDTVIAGTGTKSQGQGYNLYKALVDGGYTLLSDNVQYIGGKKLWDKIIRKAVADGYQVYILKGDKLMRGEDGKAIHFDGHNIDHNQVWKKPGGAAERAQDQEAYHTLLVATKKVL